jgi:hypothetical protein
MQYTPDVVTTIPEMCKMHHVEATMATRDKAKSPCHHD